MLWLGGNFGGRGAIAGCHSSVLWLGASMTTNFGGVDVVPLQGANGILHSNVIQKKHLEIELLYLGSMLI